MILDLRHHAEKCKNYFWQEKLPAVRRLRGLQTAMQCDKKSPLHNHAKFDIVSRSDADPPPKGVETMPQARPRNKIKKPERPCDRLQQAFENSGWGSVSEFARANSDLGVVDGTFYANLTGHRNMTRQNAELYALILGVSVDWLLKGSGDPLTAVPHGDHSLKVEYLLSREFLPAKRKNVEPAYVCVPSRFNIPRSLLFAAYAIEPLSVWHPVGTVMVCTGVVESSRFHLANLGWLAIERKEGGRRMRVTPWMLRDNLGVVNGFEAGKRGKSTKAFLSEADVVGAIIGIWSVVHEQPD